MRPDPNPKQPIFHFECKGPVATIDPRGPEVANLFQPQQGMTWILFKKFKGPVCTVPDFERQAAIGVPKIGSA